MSTDKVLALKMQIAQLTIQEKTAQGLPKQQIEAKLATLNSQIEAELTGKSRHSGVSDNMKGLTIEKSPQASNDQ